jgi:rod shape determining protein RodA
MATRTAVIGRVTRIGRTRIREPGIPKSSPLRHMDPVLMLSAVALCAFGCLMIFSASEKRLLSQGFPGNYLLARQVLFAFIGLGVAVLAAVVPYRRLRTWSFGMYAASLALLGVVLSGLGHSASGAQRWVDVGPLQLQPSEIAKIAVIVLLASSLAGARGEPGFGDVVKSVLIVGVPAVMIYRQPDLGTLLVLLAAMVGALLVAGTRVRMLIVLLVLGAVAFGGVLQLGLLKDYQVARLTAFLDPASDPLLTGYNLNQSKIAVGSGQLTGKGLFNNETQTNLDFVPEQHTDFIFTAVGEETGFLGSALLLSLYGLFLWRGIRTGMLAKDLFGALIAAGVVTMVLFQVFVNIGMTIGISPITGIPLPFVSYGGSSLITNFAATGLLLNVHMRR